VAPTFVRRSKVTEVNPLTLVSLARTPPPFFGKFLFFFVGDWFAFFHTILTCLKNIKSDKQFIKICLNFNHFLNDYRHKMV